MMKAVCHDEKCRNLWFEHRKKRKSSYRGFIFNQLSIRALMFPYVQLPLEKQHQNTRKSPFTSTELLLAIDQTLWHDSLL